MIQVLIPQNPDFQKYENEIRDLYEENQDKITDTNTFDFIFIGVFSWNIFCNIFNTYR